MVKITPIFNGLCAYLWGVKKPDPFYAVRINNNRLEVYNGHKIIYERKH